MAKKKLSTSEILAAARAQVKVEGESEAPTETSPPETPQPASPKGAPTSTADILAAARAQKAGGDASPAKPSKPAAKPTSTADILAAARAGKAGAGKAEAAPKPTSKKTEVAAATASGDHPSVQEMLQAVRSGKQSSEAAASDVAAVPAKPQRPVRPTRPTPPVKAGKKKGADQGRRWALFSILCTPFAIAWIMMGGVLTAWGLATARFMMPNVLVEPPSKFKIGPVTDYPAGTVSTKWKAEFGIWVVNTEWAGEGELVALSTVCTHLGCTPNWLGSEQKFKCPCHGSGFYITGVNFEGPAPRPLERHAIRIAADGMVEVDKSLKYQEELGQWADGNSYIKTS